MKINAYVIFDKIAMLYNKPFYFINDQIAHRAALDLMSDPTCDIAKHPTDFTMFHIGDYEDTTAQFNQLDTPRVICHFHEIQIPLPIENSIVNSTTPAGEE